MNLTRRSFLGSCIALCAAPAIVRASSLMPVVFRDPGILIYRELRAYSINVDDFVYRLDTWDGENQYHVDFRLPPSGHGHRLAAYNKAKSEAVRVLQNTVEFRHPHSTFYAPPMPNVPGFSSLEAGPFHWSPTRHLIA